MLMKKQNLDSLVWRRSRSTLWSSLVPWTIELNRGEDTTKSAQNASTRPLLLLATSKDKKGNYNKKYGFYKHHSS